MESSTLKCPKCAHPRRGNTECPSCGIIFEKYLLQERRKVELLIARDEQKQRRLKFAAISLAGIAVVGVVLMLPFSGSSEEPQSAKTTDVHEDNLRFPRNPYSEYLPQPLIAGDVKQDLAAATFGVSESRHITTAFYITDSCLALTSKIEKDTRNADHNRIIRKQNIEAMSKAVRNQEEKFEERRRDFLSKCVDCSEKAFERKLGKLKKQLKRKREELERLWESNKSSDSPENLVSLTLGNHSHRGRLVDVSHTLGLSLLAVDQSLACDPVSIADQDSVKKGDEIYLMDRNHRVTKGEITGFSKDSDGQKFIKHNAKPTSIMGYAGAPAFNKVGEVIGISIRKVDAGRYLVPIDDALLAFKIVL